MNSFDLEEHIQHALYDEPAVFARIVTYADAGALTRDAGLIVRAASGDEFQVTIVQVRRGGGE